MNMVILTGRLTADPIINNYEGFSKIEFTIAIDRDYVKKDGSKDTDFISCRTTDNTPDKKKVNFYNQYIKKGMPITVIGSWRIDVYDNKDGQRVWMNYCNIDRLKFCPINAPKDNTNTQQYTQPIQNIQQPTSYTRPIQNTQNTPVTAGKKSSWQKEIVEESQPQTNIYQQPIQNSNQVPQPSYDENIIPQAFDIGIDMSDEFMF